MRPINVRNNNGSCCIRFTLNDGSSHSLTQGSYSNPADVARMQRIALEVRESVLAGTFTGLDQYKPVKVKATVQALLDVLSQSNHQHCSSLIKLLSFRHDKVLNSKVIQECFDNASIATASKRRYLTALKSVFPEHSKHFQITMPKDKVKATNKRDPFTDTEVKLILEAFNESLYLPFVKFQLLTGIRPSEGFALRWCDIEVKENRIRIAHSVTRKTKNRERKRKDTKTGVIRYFPMNDDLSKLLSSINPIAYGSNSEALVFRNNDGKMISDETYRQHWMEKLAGTTVRYRPPYTCRHTFISHCLARGVDVATVASWVGNSPTMIYQHYAGTINHAVVPGLYS